MMIEIPIWLGIGFSFVTAITIFGLWRSTKSTAMLIGTLLILVLTGLLAWLGFYDQPTGIPPRQLLIILPSLIGIGLIFFTKWGKGVLDATNYRTLTLIHTVRVPVELTILALFIFDTMPESMTFEGRNFDVLSGLSAPFIAYFGYRANSLSKHWLITWNTICLLLVLQVVITGALAAPSVIQQIEFDQPNVAVLHFPFVWLPSVIVPIVIFGHLASLRNLLKSSA